jgi:hypothetical protein
MISFQCCSEQLVQELHRTDRTNTKATMVTTNQQVQFYMLLDLTSVSISSSSNKVLDTVPGAAAAVRARRPSFPRCHRTPSYARRTAAAAGAGGPACVEPSESRTLFKMCDLNLCKSTPNRIAIQTRGLFKNIGSGLYKKIPRSDRDQ